MPKTDYAPIYQFRRAATVESVHFGAIAVTDRQGQLLAWHGNPNTVTYLRSSAKPFQAIPFVEAGGVAAYNLGPQELALICASHSGTDDHVAVARKIQAKAQLSEADLMCGTHPPFDKVTAEAMLARGEKPTPIRHNCSGKHSGMLAYARLSGWPGEDYINPNHPLQQEILGVFGTMCGLDPGEVSLGVDGCSVPNFAIPLYNSALGYARLCDPGEFGQARAATCLTITSAMQSHPEMVGGPGRFDTRLMEVAQGKILAKGGAEGYQCIGIFPGALGSGSPAVGIAFKISDGDRKGHVRPAVALEVLRQLGALAESELAALAEFGPTLPMYNWRKLEVGESEPCFTLRKKISPSGK